MTAMTAPATHREVVIAKTGAAETLSLREGNDRAPGADEIAIDVAYSGINFADIMMRLGMYPDAPKRPFVPGYEVSGIVRAIGSNVREFAVGDRVMAGCYFGGYAARVTIPASQAFKVPAGIELDEAAGLPVAFFTAYVALVEMARVRQGDKVLIDCATGGVGTIAMQIAIKAGAEVVGDRHDPAQRDVLRQPGVGAEQPAAQRPDGGGVEVDDLAERVHAGLGAAGADDLHRVVGDEAERTLDLRLHRGGRRLPLPARVGGAGVLDACSEPHARRAVSAAAFRSGAGPRPSARRCPR